MPNATPIATVISIPANEIGYMNYVCIHSMILIHDLGIGSHIRGISFTHRKQLIQSSVFEAFWYIGIDADMYM